MLCSCSPQSPCTSPLNPFECNIFTKSMSHSLKMSIPQQLPHFICAVLLFLWLLISVSLSKGQYLHLTLHKYRFKSWYRYSVRICAWAGANSNSILQPLCIGYMMEVRPVFNLPAPNTSLDYAMALERSGFQLNVNCTRHCHCGGKSEEQMQSQNLFQLCAFLQIYARLHTDNRKICKFY